MYNDIRNKSYNIPYRLYSNQLCFSYSKVGTFTFKGYTGPNGGNSVSQNKKLAIKKSFSEMLERRSLMIGSDIDNERKVKALNLIDRKVYEILEKNIKFNDQEDIYTDTTGTSTHISSQTSIFNALKELLEKNCLFLFWYGRRGISLNSEELIRSLNFGYKFHHNQKLFMFLNNDFPPFITIISVLIEDQKIIGSGIASDLNFKQAINASLFELILLKEQKFINQTYARIYGVRQRCFLESSLEEKEQYFHLKKLKNDLPIIKINIKSFNKVKTKNIFQIVDSLPSWIESLYCVYIKHNLNNQLKTVRVYSKELYNHIPIKDWVSGSKPVSIHFNINKVEIDSTPNCPII
jgi:hypothetical protein